MGAHSRGMSRNPLHCDAKPENRAGGCAVRASAAISHIPAGNRRTTVCYGAHLGVHMSDELDKLGVEATEVRRDSAGRNVVIAVIGLVLVVAALIPLTYAAIWVGSVVYAGVVSFLTGGPAPEAPVT